MKRKIKNRSMKKEGREQRLDKGHRMENRNEKKEKK